MYLSTELGFDESCIIINKFRKEDKLFFRKIRILADEKISKIYFFDKVLMKLPKMQHLFVSLLIFSTNDVSVAFLRYVFATVFRKGTRYQKAKA